MFSIFFPGLWAIFTLLDEKVAEPEFRKARRCEDAEFGVFAIFRDVSRFRRLWQSGFFPYARVQREKVARVLLGLDVCDFRVFAHRDLAACRHRGSAACGRRDLVHEGIAIFDNRAFAQPHLAKRGAAPHSFSR